MVDINTFNPTVISAAADRSKSVALVIFLFFEWRCGFTTRRFMSSLLRPVPCSNVVLFLVRSV